MHFPAWALLAAALCRAGEGASSPRVIALDAGHGGQDLGAVVRGLREKDVALAMARALREAAHGSSFAGVLTREVDEYLPLSERVDRAGRAGAAAFLSFHVDKTRGRARRGVVLYVFGKNRQIPRGLKRAGERSLPDPPPATVADSRRLALSLKRALLAAGIEVGELERGAFGVLKSPGIPSVLVELGNVRDGQAAARVADPRFQERAARALLEGLRGYFAS